MAKTGKWKYSLLFRTGRKPKFQNPDEFWKSHKNFVTLQQISNDLIYSHSAMIQTFYKHDTNMKNIKKVMHFGSYKHFQCYVL